MHFSFRAGHDVEAQLYSTAASPQHATVPQIPTMPRNTLCYAYTLGCLARQMPYLGAGMPREQTPPSGACVCKEGPFGFSVVLHLLFPDHAAGQRGLAHVCPRPQLGARLVHL